ncbi:hypothetical protein LMG24235_08060 [Paraburkholderia sabiae]|nr:hypothetical protein LMG24235_08060 [Paraburkholderia sabiae]
MRCRLDWMPGGTTIRRCTVEHVFGTFKHWMEPAHFLTRTRGQVSTQMSLQVMAYNIKRVMNKLATAWMTKAMKVTGSWSLEGLSYAAMFDSHSLDMSNLTERTGNLALSSEIGVSTRPRPRAIDQRPN